MKKFVLMFALVLGMSFVSCRNAETTEEAKTTDTPVEATDSVSTTAVDTVATSVAL